MFTGDERIQPLIQLVDESNSFSIVPVKQHVHALLYKVIVD
jgi:hypothetical protein